MRDLLPGAARDQCGNARHSLASHQPALCSVALGGARMEPQQGERGRQKACASSWIGRRHLAGHSVHIVSCIKAETATG